MKGKNSMALRSLSFWFRLAEEYVLTMFVIALGYSIFYIFSAGSWSGYLESFPQYIILCMCILLMVTGVTAKNLYNGIALSFGSTRKNVFWGNIFMQLLMIIEVIGVLVVLYIVFPNEGLKLWGDIGRGMVLMIFACGLGNLLASVNGRFEMAVKIALGSVCGIFGFSVGVSTFGDLNLEMENLLVRLNISNIDILKIIFTVLTFLIYLLGCALYYKKIKKMEVKL